MNLLDRIPLKPEHAAFVLRIALAAIFMSHGITRAVMDRVTPFGTFLDAQGFPLGIAWAWGVTLLEIVGGALLLAGYWLRPLCVLFTIQMLTGIILVHLRHGWFVVGHGTGGMEFSVMLVAGLLALFALSQADQLARRRI
jgi:putative oxidoreductase